MYKKIFLIFSFAILASLFFTSCETDEMQNDADLVTPFIHSLNGPLVGYEAETSQYSVSPSRGGSEYIWTINGAEAHPIEGEPHKMNVYFNQFIDPVSISVVEKAANGKTSEPETMNITVFGEPCDWTINMHDSYGDGWNGAAVSFTFEGVLLGNYTIDDGAEGSATVPIPNGGNVVIGFTSGDWDSEITFEIYDASGALVYEDGPTPEVGDAVNESYNTCP